MASSGTVESVTFTPSVACDVVVTATFEAQRTTGGDWGSGALYKLFKTQSASTTYGDERPVSTTRIAYTATFIFSVAAGASCEVGLFGQVTGASAVSFYNCTIVAEEIRR